MGRRERRRHGRRQQQSSPDSKIELVYKNPGVIKLLFETPSGFAMFAIAESYLEKDIEHIWTYFIGDFWCNNIVWLHEFQKFEDKPNAINLTTRKINPRLIKMILKYIKFEEKLVVGRPEYKDIIEELLDLPCLYSDAVEEVMWGMQNLLRTIVPEEKSEMPMEDRIPMSKGLDMVLRRHGFVVEPKMINEHIIETANTMYDIDLRERVHSKYLHNLLDEVFMKISGVDIEDWPLLKLATAVKKMCYPDEGLLVGDPYEMFSRRDAEVIWDDAAKYRDKMDENIILRIYRDVVFLREDKRTARNKLRRLVREAKEALEAEELLEELATAGVNSKHQVNHTCLTVDPPAVPSQSSVGAGKHSITDHMKNICLHDTSANNSSMWEGQVHTSRSVQEAKEEMLEEPATAGVNSKHQVNHTCLMVDPPAVPNQSSIGEGQHSMTDRTKNICSHDTSANHSRQEGGEHTSSIFPQGVPVELTTLSTSKEIDALSTYYVKGEVPEKETSVKQTGATPGGDNVGNATVDVKEQAQETCAETEAIVGQKEHKTQDSDEPRPSLTSGTNERKKRWTLFSCFH